MTTARRRSRSCLLRSVRGEFVNPEVLFFSDEAWLHLTGQVLHRAFQNILTR